MWGHDVGRSRTLFIHRDLHNGKRRVVSHRPTGRLIASFKTLKRARKFATVLDGLAGGLMRSTRDAHKIPAGFRTAVREAHIAVDMAARTEA